MPIVEYLPEKSVFLDTYRKITDTNVKSSDPMVSHLCDLASQLRSNILSLENTRTVDLAKVLSHADTTLVLLSPETVLEIRRELETAADDGDREMLKKALAEAESAQRDAREQFNAVYFPTAKKIRDKCYAVAQSNMADYIIETLADRRKALDRLAKLSEETLIPLMKNLEAQIADIDQALSKKLDENIFETVLRLLPPVDTVTGLVKKSGTTPQQGGTKPSAPAQAAKLPDKGRAAAAVAEGTAAPEAMPFETVVTADGQSSRPAQEPAPAAAAPAAAASATAAAAPAAAAAAAAAAPAAAASLTGIIPEEAALKLAYQTLQSTLTYIGESEKVYQQISKRQKLWESLEDLRKKYDDIQRQYRAISLDIEDLDRLNQFLGYAGAYFTEAEKLDTTLTAYAGALNTAGKDPMAYYVIFLMLRRYMQKLDLYWR